MERHINKKLNYLSPEKLAELSHPKPFKRLPFIHVGKRGVNSYWAVPAKGEYFGGYEVGKEMAHAFLKHLATNNDSLDFHMLQSIICCQESRLQAAVEKHNCSNLPTVQWPEEPASLRGQRAGFLNTIGEVLAVVVRAVKPAFDDLSEDEIVQRANTALSRTDAQLLEIATKLDKEKQKHAA